MAAEIHMMLRSRHPGLLTIIVPRHPERALALAVEFAAMGLKVVMRSSGERIRSDTDILLGDTIGEMGLYLRLTEIAFVGRSLTSEGGQNPLEPAMLETAVLAGRNVQNFREAYQRLIDSGAARLVADRDMLAGAVNFLLLNDGHRRTMMAAGAATVEEMRGALAKTLKALEPFIHPLIVKARLEGIRADHGERGASVLVGEAGLARLCALPAVAHLQLRRHAADDQRAARKARRAGALRRQFHRRRNRQDAGGDRARQAGEEDAPDARLPVARLWRQHRRAACRRPQARQRQAGRRRAAASVGPCASRRRRRTASPAPRC